MVYTAALVIGHVPPVSPERQSVIDMIGKYLFQLTSPGRESCGARRGSVESGDEMDGGSPYANLERDEERVLQQAVIRQMERCLTAAKASTLHCQVLLLPRHMTARVVQDVTLSSADEPCGLRGASIEVYVEGKDGLKSLGSISPDPAVTPTFEMSVILKTDGDGGWPSLRNIFDANKVVKLRPEYRLVKRKLYSSASPVIHDFN